MRILIFNPDSEYAMACNSPYYTPPESILQIADRNALAMLPLAEAGDIILVSDRVDKSSLCTDLGCDGVEILSDTELSDVLAGTDDKDTIEVIPWGWNRSLKHRLQNIGIPVDSLPSDEYLDKIRELSHRRTSLEIDKELTPGAMSRVIYSVEEALNWLNDYPESYFKSPWSSSGRGILRTSDLELRHIEPWVRGAIRHQGCVIAEKEEKRALDCATEWIINNGTVSFIGLSVFKVSPRGKYSSNISGTQSELRKIIESYVEHETLENVISRQKETISDKIAPYYSGPLGIDMYVTEDKRLRACVEINLRYTMGILELYK